MLFQLTGKVFYARLHALVGHLIRVSIGLGLLFSCSLPPVAAQSQDWCVTDGSYNPIVISMAAHLRWSLFAISTLAETEASGDVGAISDFADAAVISLANTISLRAAYAHGCSINQSDYNQKIHDDQAFVTFFLDITSDERFPSYEAIRNKHPELLLHDTPPDVVLRNHHLPPFDQALMRRLYAIKSDPALSEHSPYLVAVRLLLGYEPVWRENQLAKAAVIPANAESPLYGKTLTDWGSLMQTKTSMQLLNYLRGYYNRPSKGAPGVPSVLVGQ